MKISHRPQKQNHHVQNFQIFSSTPQYDCKNNQLPQFLFYPPPSLFLKLYYLFF